MLTFESQTLFNAATLGSGVSRVVIYIYRERESNYTHTRLFCLIGLSFKMLLSTRNLNDISFLLARVELHFALVFERL
jgi:hypothetical protein